jgi:hypothetical protein
MPTHEHSTSTVRYLAVVEDPRYRVGDDGSAWSRTSGEWKRLEGDVESSGYIGITMAGRRRRLVHRLVLEAFVGPCPEGMLTRHLDGDPANNHLDNLRWGTPAENFADSVRHGTAACLRPEARERMRAGSPDHPCRFVRHRSGERHHRAKLSDLQVAIVRGCEDGGKPPGVFQMLARLWGVSGDTLRKIAKGKRRRRADPCAS